jgi:dipeptidase E
MKRRLLLLSNSTNHGEEYLFSARHEIKKFLGSSVTKVLFIPFANVSSFDNLTEKVGVIFQELGYSVDGIHVAKNYIESIKTAEAIVVAGGNTFNLFHWLHQTGIIEAIREKVNNGTPYVGWSAGSNAACPTLKTTNDMPIIEPVSFQGLNLVPFQINPHYTNESIANHKGETREERIKEFIQLNKNVYVVGLREGTMLNIEGSSMKLIGNKPMIVFKFNEPINEYNSNDNLNFLIEHA